MTSKAEQTKEQLRIATTGVPVVTGVKKYLLLILAGLSVIIAGAGIVLPGLPTTPFLLLTSYCLLRSSPRLNAALLKSRVFGAILADWQQRGAVRVDVKVKAISFVVIAVAVSLLVSQPPIWMFVTVLILAAVGVAVIFMLPTITP